MKKVLSVILAITMLTSLTTYFTLNSFAEKMPDSNEFYADKTSVAPILDGQADSLYGDPIFSVTGKDLADASLLGGYDYRFPLGYNRNEFRYDVKEHPLLKDADWWNCNITGYAAWDDDYLYFLVIAKNAGILDDNPNAIWYGDGIQLSVYDNGTTEYTFAKSGTSITAKANVTDSLSITEKINNAYGPERLPDGGIYQIDSDTFAYELALDWKALGINPSETTSFGFNTSINMNDENMDINAFCGIQITYGIYNETNPSKSGMAFASKMNLVNDDEKIENISAEYIGAPLIEKADGYFTEEYNFETGNYDSYFYYDIDYSNIYITVNYANGNVVSGAPYEIYDKTGYYPEIIDNQDYNNQLSVGKNTGSVSFMGTKADFEFEIMENPIESISVISEKPLYQNIDGQTVYDYNPETDDYDLEYFCYSISNYSNVYITVYYKDGSSISGTADEIIEMTGYVPDFYGDQNYNNQWDIGIHTMTASFMGVNTEFEVEIAESNIESISATLIKPLIEKADGYTAFDIDSATGEFINKYFHYSVSPDNVYITVNYKDGSSISGTVYEIGEQTEHFPEYNDDQNYDNQWGVGTYTATVSLMGIDTELEIKIEETTVESISVTMQRPLIKGVDSITVPNENEEEFTMYLPGLYALNTKMTIKYKDGTEISGTFIEILRETGYAPEITDDQDFDNQWDIGKHTATATFMGAIADFEIEIKNGSDYVSAEIVDTKNLTIKLTLKDGTTETITANAFIPVTGEENPDGSFTDTGLLLTDKGTYITTFISEPSGTKTVELFGLQGDTVNNLEWYDILGISSLRNNVIDGKLNEFSGEVTDENSDDIIFLAFSLFSFENEEPKAQFTTEEIKEIISKYFGDIDIDVTKSKYYNTESGNLEFEGTGTEGIPEINYCSYKNGEWITTRVSEDKVFTVIYNEDLTIKEIYSGYPKENGSDNPQIDDNKKDDTDNPSVNDETPKDDGLKDDVKPSGNNNTKEPEKSENQETSDTSVIIWLLLLIISGTVLAWTILSKKKSVR